MTNVLVTGTGAVIGYGILQCLRRIGQVRSIACDIYPHAAGQHFAASFHKAPPTKDPLYAQWLSDLVEKESVDLIIPGIEQDVAWLASVAGTPVAPPTRLALNRPEVVRLCSDKIAFDQFLEESEDPVRIPSLRDQSFSRLASVLGLPFLLKPRAGYAGKGIVRVRNEADFAPYAQDVGNLFLAQRIVGDDTLEFTVSAFCTGGLIRAAIALRRILSPEGATVWAETVDADLFLPAMHRIAERLGAEGPTNFQFRIVDESPLLLEINPRISSATSMRAAFGFNEAEMCINHYLLGKKIVQPEIRRGSAVRYLADIVTP